MQFPQKTREFSHNFANAIWRDFNGFSLSRLRECVVKIAIRTTSCQSLHLSGAKEFLGSSPHRSTKHWVASVRSVWFTTTKSNIILVGSQQKTLQKSEQQIIEGKPLFLLNFDVRFIGLESVVTSEKRLIWFYVNFACCEPILLYYFLRVLIFRIFSCLAESKVTFHADFHAEIIENEIWFKKSSIWRVI